MLCTLLLSRHTLVCPLLHCVTSLDGVTRFRYENEVDFWTAGIEMKWRCDHCSCNLYLRTFVPIATAHLWCARYTWHVACHVMYFKRAHQVETQQNIELMTFAVTWSANIFVGCSVTSSFFFGRSLPFLILSIILKKKKFNYFSYTIQIGLNWYIDTGVRDLEGSCFKANSTWINDIGSKDLANRPTYAVLNTQLRI